GPAEHQQVVGDDPEPHPTLHPALAAVPAAPQAMTALERADPSFTSRSPAEGHAVTPRAGFAGLAREHDVPDPALASSALVRRRSKAAIGDGELRGAVKELDMPIQGGSPQGLLRLPALTDRVIGDELSLGLLDLHQPPELRGLGQLALADDVRVRLEQTDDLTRIVRVAAEHAGPRLGQHMPDEVDRRGQVAGGALTARSCHCALGLAHHRARDAHESLVEDLHFRLAPRAHLRPKATSRASTSLSTGSSRRRASRISVFASGTRSPSIRQNARYTKLPRTSRSHSSKLQSWRCLRTSIRRTTAAGVPSRPRH